MRTWSGLVDLMLGDELLGQVHADLAAEERSGEQVWWGQLRGAAVYDVGHRPGTALRLPDGRIGQVAKARVDDHDLYHRAEIDGEGQPPF